MPVDLQILIKDSRKRTDPTGLCLPAGIPHTTFDDVNQLKRYAVTQSMFLSFIILVLDVNDPNLSPVLEELKKEENLFAIYICVKPKKHLKFTGENVFPIAKQLITRKITFSVIQFFELTSKKLLTLNLIGAAYILKQKANELKQQRFTNGQIKGCHVLIIPLNTTDDNLFDFQERMINLSNDLCDDYEPIVNTLYDYIPADAGSYFHDKQDADAICKYVKTISSIRIYLIGNEYSIPNSSCKCLFDNELDGGDNYDTKYTLIENEPVSDQIKSNLAEVLGCTRPSTDMVVKRLEQIQHDIQFPDALQRVNVTLQGREMVADVALIQQTVANLENSCEHSGQLHTVEDAMSGPTEQNNGGSENINDKIQSDLS